MKFDRSKASHKFVINPTTDPNHLLLSVTFRLQFGPLDNFWYLMTTFGPFVVFAFDNFVDLVAVISLTRATI